MKIKHTLEFRQQEIDTWDIKHVFISSILSLFIFLYIFVVWGFFFS